MSPQPPDHSGRIRNASLDKPLAADAGYASETPSRGGATDISGLELGSVVQEDLPVAFFVTAASIRANAMRAVPDAPRGQQDRRMAQDSIFADLLSATVCGLVIVVAVFGAIWLCSSMPETSGRSLEQIEELFKPRRARALPIITVRPTITT